MRPRAPALWLLALVAIAAPAAAAGPGPSPTTAAEGTFVSISLEPMTGKYALDTAGVLDLFTASADSAVWYGPTRPNPHSWLSPSVFCRDTLDFRVECGPAEGAAVDTLRFTGVPPGSYRLRVAKKPQAEPGLYVFRHRYRGAVVHEGKLMLTEPR